MKNPFVTIVRAIAVHRNASKVKTGFVSLQKVDSVAVFINAEEQDSQNCADFVTAFFSKCNIKLKLYAISLSKEPVAIMGATALTHKDISIFGLPRRSKRHPQIGGQEDLFINLVGTGTYVADYCAICSQAKMKVGRIQPGRDVYDLLILKSEGFTQSEVFKQMTGILMRVR